MIDKDFIYEGGYGLVTGIEMFNIDLVKKALNRKNWNDSSYSKTLN